MTALSEEQVACHFTPLRSIARPVIRKAHPPAAFRSEATPSDDDLSLEVPLSGRMAGLLLRHGAAENRVIDNTPTVERTSMNMRRAIACCLGTAAAGVALSRIMRATRAIDFNGRSVLIFGGSRGLGLVIARELAAEGARVTLAARSRKELERAQSDLIDRGLSADMVVCDVRYRSDVDATVERVASEQGTIDVL